jgi:DNA topoisomerase-1
VLKDFYGPFSEDVKKAEANHRAIQKTTQEATDEVCEKCGKPMVIRWGKRGRFLACSGYPECKNTKPLNGEEAVPVEGEKCGTCGAPMLLKTGRFGKFLACSRYPECKTTRPVSTGVPCPEKDCGGTLVERQSKRRKVFYSCSNYPKCKFALWDKPVKQPCPACGAPFLVSKFTKAKGPHLKCVKCNHVVEQPQAETKVAQPA